MEHVHNDTQIAPSELVPKWEGADLPDNATVIVLVDEENYDMGGTIQAAYQLDLDRITANTLKAGNSTVISSPEADITVPEGTVVPAYVEIFDDHSVVRAQASSETTKAQFLIIKRAVNVDNSYVVQSTGYYTFPEPHNYEVGQKYYLSASAEGGVTTEPPVSAVVQPLFSVLSDTVIQINVGV